MHVCNHLYMQVMEALSQRVRDDSPDSKKMNGESSTYYDASEARRHLYLRFESNLANLASA